MPTIDLMAAWKQAISYKAGPMYLSIVDTLADAIRKGELQEGDRLPPQREIAKTVGTDLTTVTRAFAEARRRGLIEATVGRGTFVRVGAGQAHWRQAGRAVIDLTMNLPPIPQDPPLQTLIQTDMSRMLKQQDIHALMSYRVTGGTLEERQLAVAWMKPVLGPRNADDVLVVPGAQSALTAIVSTLTSPGDAIITDRFTYPGIRSLAAQFGLILTGVDGDGEGMIPELVERACRQHKPRLLYCTPAIQNPTTATMSLKRRQDILAVAKRHHLQIIEDDPYSLLLDDPLPALAALDPSRVYYVATLAKVLSPGLRTAYFATPGSSATQRMSAALSAVALTCPGLLTGLVTRWMREGTAQDIRAAIRKELRLRQAIARRVLGDGHCMHKCGPHVWLKLPSWWGSVDFVSYARHHGLALVPSTVFTVEGEPAQRVRIALGSAPNTENLEASLRGVVSVLQHKRSPGFSDIV